MVEYGVDQMKKLFLYTKDIFIEMGFIFFALFSIIFICCLFVIDKVFDLKLFEEQSIW